MFPICLLFRWHHSECQTNQRRANNISSRGNLVSLPQHAKELNFSLKWWLLIWEGKISQPYQETRGKKVKFIYLCKTWKYYILPFWGKNASRKEKRWNLGTNDLLGNFNAVFLGYNTATIITPQTELLIFFTQLIIMPQTVWCCIYPI